MYVLVTCYVNHWKILREPFKTGEGSSLLLAPLILTKDLRKEGGALINLVDRVEKLGAIFL